MLSLGIDEAGRGPVIGPMIIAGIVLDEEGSRYLTRLGVTDSKRLTPNERKRLFNHIIDVAKHVIVVEVPPEVIDRININVIERDTIAYIAARAKTLWRNTLSRIIVDAVGDPRKLTMYLRRIGFNGKIIAEYNADEKYIEVSAASIIAKVVRDSIIDELRRIYGVKGSGYPTDPKTIEWIKEEYTRNPNNPPHFIRRSWSTLKKIAPQWYIDKSRMVNGSQKKLLDYLFSRNNKNNH